MVIFKYSARAQYNTVVQLKAWLTRSHDHDIVGHMRFLVGNEDNESVAGRVLNGSGLWAQSFRGEFLINTWLISNPHIHDD